MRKRLALHSSLALSVLLALPALSSDQPARPVAASAAQAPALSSENRARLAKLQALGAPDPKMAVASGAPHVIKSMAVKKEIHCGVWVYPPNPNPNSYSSKLYWVNSTGAVLPAGTHIQWEVEGVPATCCKGTTGATPPIPPNPPSPAFFYSMAPLLSPAQPWTRPCKAWAILP